jgi:hypothetical protein
MFSLLGRIVALCASLGFFVGLTVFLAMGGAILVFPVLAALTPALIFTMIGSFRSAQAQWRSIPASVKLERYAEQVTEPILITHRDSTEIIYANSSAQEVLGDSLVGRTAHSESGLMYKPVRVDGLPVERDNHPAIRMKSIETKKAKANVTWLTPEGEKAVELRVRRLDFANALRGDFLLVKVRLEEQAG